MDDLKNTNFMLEKIKQVLADAAAVLKGIGKIIRKGDSVC